MNIIGGKTVEVFRRPERDRFGDAEPVSVGTIDRVVFQWGSTANRTGFRSGEGFRETADLGAVMFIPNDASVTVTARDRIKMGGDLFQVVGSREWDEPHPATGFNFGYYMVQVEAVV